MTAPVDGRDVARFRYKISATKWTTDLEVCELPGEGYYVGTQCWFDGSEKAHRRHSQYYATRAQAEAELRRQESEGTP